MAKDDKEELMEKINFGDAAIHQGDDRLLQLHVMVCCFYSSMTYYIAQLSNQCNDDDLEYYIREVETFWVFAREWRNMSLLPNKFYTTSSIVLLTIKNSTSDYFDSFNHQPQLYEEIFTTKIKK